jgi:hypothetical protein
MLNQSIPMYAARIKNLSYQIEERQANRQDIQTFGQIIQSLYHDPGAAAMATLETLVGVTRGSTCLGI